MREKYILLVLVIFFSFVSLLNYIFYSSFLSYIFQYLLLLPIMLSSYFYGASGGVLTSAGCFFIYLPLTIRNTLQNRLEDVVEDIILLTLFAFLGIFSGVLFEREKFRKNYYYLLMLFHKKLSEIEDVNELTDEFSKFIQIHFRLYKVESITPSFDERIRKTKGIGIFVQDSFFQKFFISIRISPEKYLVLRSADDRLLRYSSIQNALIEIFRQFLLKKEVLLIQHQIKQYLNFVENIVSYLPVGIVIYQKGNLLYANKTYEDMLEKGEIREGIWKSIEEKLAEKNHLSFTEDNITIEVNINLWEDDKFVITFKDVSSKRKTLLHAFSDNTKADMVSIFSHEIKTPITSIKGFILTLLDDKDEYFKEEERINFYNIIKEETYRLSRLVADLLDLSEIERNKNLQIIPEKVDIVDIINKVVSMMRLTTHHNFKVISDCRQYVFGDKDRIMQILFNLLSNAVKYSPSGKNIFVTVEKENNFAKISIIDEGDGIEKEHIPQLFEKEKYFKDKITGLGLGLYLTKNLVERQGGRIWVESIKNFGTSSTFTLPLY